jgi:hypothetical protein
VPAARDGSLGGTIYLDRLDRDLRRQALRAIREVGLALGRRLTILSGEQSPTVTSVRSDESCG